ncbi:AtpZ/AtpI family protein [Balneola vulgaris]|uniref:AtpZ/AtpI family protein n=1 Tax=Balneola vulgaris TaxID=287535 RepID=UPI0014615E08|nr:AtpZ/AtpI family protein [Balneola vulgaris]
MPKEYAEYLGLGAEIAASLFIPIISGYFIDQYFDTSPIAMLIGVAVGVGIFFSLMIRVSRTFTSSNKNEDRSDD